METNTILKQKESEDLYTCITNNTIMSDTTISVRIDEELYNRMQIHEEINWSGMIRSLLSRKIDDLESIDLERAKVAVKNIDKIRSSSIFGGGKDSTELIREWRDKRK